MPGVPPTPGQPSADCPSAYGRDPHGQDDAGPSWALRDESRPAV